MTFADIANGASVFVDANTFVYYLAADPVFGPACKQFFERIDRQEIVAFTSTQELSDVAHRLMTMEAMARFGWPANAIAQRLRNHSAEISKLTTFCTAVADIANSKVQFLHVPASLCVDATTISRRFGLLNGDALIVAILQQNGLTHLASHDADFDRVPGITRYGPIP